MIAAALATTALATALALLSLSPVISPVSPLPMSTSPPISSMHMKFGKRLMHWPERIKVSFCPLSFLSRVMVMCVLTSIPTVRAASTIPKDQSMKYMEYLGQGVLAEILGGDILMSVPIKRLSWHPQTSKSYRMRVLGAGNQPARFMVTQEV